MSMAEFLVGEFDHESGTTRKVLERVPEEHAAWAPHTKSKSMGELANHIAGLPVWVGRILNAPEYDFLAPGAPTPGIRPWESTEGADARTIAGTPAEFVGITAAINRGRRSHQRPTP